jgi:hypothetical protein
MCDSKRRVPTRIKQMTPKRKVTSKTMEEPSLSCAKCHRTKLQIYNKCRKCLLCSNNNFGLKPLMGKAKATRNRNG